MNRKLYMLAACLIAIVIASPAAKAGSLEDFKAQKTYSGSFADVPAGSWYAAGVKTAYEYGVMDGVGNGAFNPGGTVSVAEAVTVASRVHAQYHGQVIADASGAWYEKYSLYAEENGMLPPDLDPRGDLTAPATRAVIAYVFSGALDAADLPAVNTGVEISDFELIAPDYQDAVKKMYEGGIITGVDGGRFSPDDNATRAQMAVILMRLMEPCERASSDPKLDSAFAAQVSNVMNQVPIYYGENGTSIVALGNVEGGVYFQYTENEATTLKKYPNNVANLILSGQYAYFTQANFNDDGTVKNEQFIRYDPASERTTVLYATKNNLSTIDQVTLYNGTFYFPVVRINTGAADIYTAFHTDIYSVTPGASAKIVCSVEGLSQKIAAFHDTLYFDNLSDLYAYDLIAKGKPQLLLSDVADWVMQGNTVYYTDSAAHVCKMAANYPGLCKTLATIAPVFSQEPYGMCVNYTDGKLYILDESSNLYRLDGDSLTLLTTAQPAAYSLGITGDLFYYRKEIYESWQSADGKMGLLSAPDSTFSMFDWYFMYNMPENASQLSCDTASVPVDKILPLSLTNRFNSIIGWDSSDTSVATVANGVVSPVSEGTAVITATVAMSGQELSCAVTVTPKGSPVPDTGFLPNLTEGSPTPLTAQEIYNQCSAGVFWLQTYSSADRSYSLGSGFFITSDGLAVTNYHVIMKADYMQVTTTDGVEYPVTEIVAVNENYDLALIRVSGSGFTPLPIGNSALVTGGQTIYAIGNPLGFTNSISNGLVSNPTRTLYGIDFIQISAPISQGSSGGALINEYGQVVGVTAAGSVDGENVNLAVPINLIYTVLQDIEE